MLMIESMSVIPAEAGIHGGGRMDSRLRGNDKLDMYYKPQ